MTPPVALVIGILAATVPVIAGVWLLRARPVGRWRELVRLAFVLALSLLFLLAGPWVWATYWLRPVAAGILIVGVMRSMHRLIRRVPAPPPVPRHPRVMLIGAVALLVAAGSAVHGNFATDDTLVVDFPLAGGRFVVLQGGNSPLTNPLHYGHRPGRLSLDVVALAPSGNRARRLHPRDVQDYAIFGTPVRSPCTGEVVAAVDGLRDNPPGQPDTSQPPGNHIVLTCDGDAGIVLLLAHLQEGSVTPQAGERVGTGAVIGAVGNSGHSSEPHLHIQATRGDLLDGHPVSLLFRGRFLSANNLMSVPRRQLGHSCTPPG